MSGRIPERLTRERLVAVLEDIVTRVREGDSLEGSIEWLLPADDADSDVCSYDVATAYRVGNRLGQGGMHLIGSVPDVPPEHAEDVSRQLLSTTDAVVWAQEYARIFPAGTADIGTMIGWFANAIETGAMRERTVVQVRDLESDLDPFVVGSVSDAFAYARANPSTWKISWDDGGDRIRLVREFGDRWRYAPLMEDVTAVLRERDGGDSDA